VTAAPTAVHEAERRVVCPGCGDVRWLTARNARGVARGESSGLCERCRFPGRPSTPEERAAAMRWWLDRYSDSQLAELALGLGVEGACAQNVARRRAVLR